VVVGGPVELVRAAAEPVPAGVVLAAVALVEGLAPVRVLLAVQEVRVAEVQRAVVGVALELELELEQVPEARVAAATPMLSILRS
jgi:hypothetical protein